MAKRKLTKAIDLVNEVNEKIAEVKGLLSDYEVQVYPITIGVPFGLKELAQELKAEVHTSPTNDVTGWFDAYFDIRGARFVTYCINERERPFYEEENQ